MPFTELLADSEFPSQGIIVILVLVFSFIKWLFGKFFKKPEEENSDALEALYEQYRDEIRQRQTRTLSTPPPVNRVAPPPVIPPVTPAATPPAVPTPPRETQSAYSMDDVRRARKFAATSPYAAVEKKKRKRSSDASSPQLSFKQQLKQPASLRQAILFREVLGKPKALQ